MNGPVRTVPVDVTAFVDGKRVKAIYALLRHPGFLITPDMGTHECTRLFVEDGKARASERADGKIGPGVVLSVQLDTARGLRIETTRGVIWSPSGDVQATWVP